MDAEIVNSNFVGGFRDYGRGDADLAVRFQKLFANKDSKVSLLNLGELTTDDFIEFCICWASMFLDRDYIVKQMQDFFSSFGKVFPEDEFYHARMSYFIELFVLDHVLANQGSGNNTTCYYSFLNSIDDASKSKFRDILYSIGSFRHSLFRVKKHTKTGILITDSLADVSYDVKPKSNETLRVLEKGTVFQGFVFPIDKMAWLGQGMIVHSPDVWSVVNKKIKLERKQNTFDDKKFLQWLALKQLLAYRHKKVSAKLIYSEKIYGNTASSAI